MVSPDVSVIVPIYNTKDYLKKCLDSLMRQTLKSIEIILIDDGSTDGSSIICDEYAKRDKRFRVIHKKKNEGLSSARNDGISMSKSEYIMFVDSDDWVEPNFCETPFRVALENDADLVCFQCYSFGKNGEKRNPSFPVIGIIQNVDVLTRYWHYTYATSMNKLYHKWLFSGIDYPIGRYSEDLAIAHKLIYKAKTIIFINSYLYHYQIDRPGSICNSGSANHRRDHLYYTFAMQEDLERWGISYEIGAEFAISYLLCMGGNAEFSDKCAIIIKNSKEHVCSWKRKLLLLIYKYSPEIFYFIADITGRRLEGNK